MGLLTVSSTIDEWTMFECALEMQFYFQRFIIQYILVIYKQLNHHWTYSSQRINNLEFFRNLLTIKWSLLCLVRSVESQILTTQGTALPPRPSIWPWRRILPIPTTNQRNSKFVTFEAEFSTHFISFEKICTSTGILCNKQLRYLTFLHLFTVYWS
jgi:hypothetical protein